MEEILNATQPQTKTHLRQFLGLVRHYSRFIAGFATWASPLMDLLDKKQPEKLSWDSRVQGAFEDLQQPWSLPQSSCESRLHQPFVVQTNASGMGLGAVLTQIIAGEEHPIAYISGKLQPAEQKYSTIERETLVVKWAVKALQFYLVKNLSILLTGHAPLQWLHMVKDSNCRVLRWYLSLLLFSFQTCHWKGCDNRNANYLSCLFDTDYCMPRGGGDVTMASAMLLTRQMGEQEREGELEGKDRPLPDEMPRPHIHGPSRQ